MLYNICYMDNFNKLFSFILGLIVVVVFFAVLTGRINFNNKFIPLTSFNKTTPTPTKSKLNPDANLNKKVISSLEVANTQNTSSYKNNSSPVNLKTIPSTGSETMLLPFMFSGLLGGIFLRRKK